MIKAALVFVSIVLSSCRQASREPVTLRYSHSWLARPDDIARTAALSQEFTRETGIRIENIPTPESTHDYLQLLRKLLPEQTAGTDLLGIDLIWSSILEPDLVDLRPYLTSDLLEIAPQLLATYSVKGKLIALPRNVPIGGLEYRADLLREYGFDHPPKTWDELEFMAQRIQNGERAKGRKDFWGYVWQGAAAEALTCNALEWQAAEGGGRIIEEDQTISVNNPANISAWKRARHWIGWISPPSVIAFRERDSMNVFDSGSAAFDRIWLITPITRTGRVRHIYWRSSRPTVETGFANIPGGSAGFGGTLGGNGLAVAQNSPHRKESIELLKFLIRAQIEEGGKYNSGLAALPESYDLPPITSDQQHASGIVTRPSVQTGSSYEQVTNAYYSAVHSVLTGQKPSSEAAAELEKLLIKITGFSTGPPRPAQ